MTDAVGFILAAGHGTRLKPATDFCPKPLIPVAGLEPLFFSLCRLESHGIRRVVVNSHHLAPQIRSAVESWRSYFPQMELRVSEELPEILGTSGAIFKVMRDHEGWFSSSTSLVVINGDVLGGISLQPLLAVEDSGLAVSFRADHLAKYGPVWVDDEGRWRGRGRTAPLAGLRAAHFLGTHKIGPRALAAIRKHAWPVAPGDLFDHIYSPLRSEGLEFKWVSYFNQEKDGEFWFDINTPELFLEAQRWILSHLQSGSLWEQALRRRYPNLRESKPRVWSSDPLADANSIEGPSVLIGSGFKNLRVAPYTSLVASAGLGPDGEALRIGNASLLRRKDSSVAAGGQVESEVKVL